MTDEQIQRILDNPNFYDDAKEDGLGAMARDFYSRNMLSTAAFVWVWAILFVAGAVYSGVQFFRAEEVRQQIMYAVIFICCYESVGFMKVFAWEMIHRRGIKREIKKLELRVVDLNETVRSK